MVYRPKRPKKGCEEICICLVLAETKKSNLERDLRKETDIKRVTKGNRKIPHTLFQVFYLSIRCNKKGVNI